MTTAERLKAIEVRIADNDASFHAGAIELEEYLRLRSYLCRRAVAVFSELSEK
jgi:hypothetical protein